MQPVANATPRVRITFDLGGLTTTDIGYAYNKFEFRGMVNGGYIIKATLIDANYNILNNLIENGYLKESRSKPVYVTFQIQAGPQGTYPNSATRVQKAILVSLSTKAGPDAGRLEFVAIDPPSWYLNRGDASGQSYKGRVDQVIQKVVNQYAPGISVEVGRTVDSEQNRWWMMRQDPKTFISSLMDWSASITQRKTQWLLESDGNQLVIKEQGMLQSKQRAFYRYFDINHGNTISSMELLADNALNVVQSKLITAGSAAISGQYLDRITDQSERKVFVKDSRTENKQIAKVNDDQAFSHEADNIGWTQVSAVPEIYSAGDLGIGYDEYIDGRPRAMWLNLVNSLLRAKFSVLGHGEWSSGRGLGVDTIFVKWTAARRSGSSDYWWVTGNWLVYGFHHVVSRDKWMTDLYCARYEADSVAHQVGGLIA